MAVSGTSCSAPIFAGLIALMNNERLVKREGGFVLTFFVLFFWIDLLNIIIIIFF